MTTGKAWTIQDRYNNHIYLTWERWEHIIDPDNHPEVEAYFEYVSDTLRRGRRKQDKYDPNSYQYYQSFPGLPDGNNHLIVCTRFRWKTDSDGRVQEEKFVTTAYFQLF